VVDLTAGQIATLQSVPVVVVPEPAAGYVVHPIAATLEYVPGAVAFDNTPSGLTITTGLGTTLFTSQDINFAGLVGQFGWFAPNGPIPADTADLALFRGLKLTCGQEPSGAGDGTARLSIVYCIVALAA
jgi:hypothetical protein